MQDKSNSKNRSVLDTIYQQGEFMKKTIAATLFLISLMSTSLMAEVKIFCTDPFYYRRTEIVIDNSGEFEGTLGNYYDFWTGKISFEEVINIGIKGESKIVQEQEGLVLIDLFENSVKVGTLTAYPRATYPDTKFSELIYKGKSFGNMLQCSF
jgi:hypothetical protein